ncbi:MAG: acyl-CoA dehydrogenase family protein [Candidatus Binatia bacterium]
MNFDLDDSQRLLQETARDFLQTECGSSVIRELEASPSGHSPARWKQIADLGWLGILVPEQYGGLGLGLLDMAVVFEEVGRAAFDSPLYATTFATLALVAAGTDAQKRDLLPRITTGDLVATFAWAEPAVVADARFVATQARAAAGDYRLRGTKVFVPYATVAGEAIVVARTAGTPGEADGLTLLSVAMTSPGLQVSPLRTISPEKQYRLDLADVPVPMDRVLGQLGRGWTTLRAVVEQATALRCAELVGGAQHELEITAAYTKQRVQFDRPLATFQAVQHRLADMFTDVHGARWTSYQAISRLSRGLPVGRELAIAAAFTTDACQRVAFGAQQLHGGAGVDVANDLHFYYRRAKALELQVGASATHLKALEERIGLPTARP